MKTHRLLFPVALLASAALAFAAEKIVAGPKGGRLLETPAAKAELFVTPAGKAEVTFYDASLKPVAPGDRTVTLIAEPKSGRTPVALEKTAHGFASKDPLPAGAPYRLVVQVREKPDAAPKNFRIDLNLEKCGECKYAEYACTCGH